MLKEPRISVSFGPQFSDMYPESDMLGFTVGVCFVPSADNASHI
jgi:hypothetical protein